MVITIFKYLKSVHVIFYERTRDKLNKPDSDCNIYKIPTTPSRIMLIMNFWLELSKQVWLWGGQVICLHNFCDYAVIPKQTYRYGWTDKKSYNFCMHNNMKKLALVKKSIPFSPYYQHGLTWCYNNECVQCNMRPVVSSQSMVVGWLWGAIMLRWSGFAILIHNFNNSQPPFSIRFYYCQLQYEYQPTTGRMQILLLTQPRKILW